MSMQRFLGGLALALATASCLAQTQAPVCDAGAAGQDACVAGSDHMLLQRQARHDKGISVDVAERSNGRPVIKTGDEVLIVAHTGRALTLENGILHAHSPLNGAEDQIFIAEKDDGGPIRPGDHIFLKGHNGNYVTVDQNKQVHAQWQNERGSWQEFEVEVKSDSKAPIRDGDTIFLRAWSDDSQEHRITVMPEGEVESEGVEVHAMWDHQGSWQELVINKVKTDVETTATPTTTTPSTTPSTSTTVPATTAAPSTTTSTTASPACAAAWHQCGGPDWKGAECCVQGFRCHKEHAHHSLCVPEEGKTPGTEPTTGTTTEPAPGTTAGTTTEAPSTATTTTSPATSATTSTTASPTTTTTKSTATTTSMSPSPAPEEGTWVRGSWTTGYWDCCKPSCSWPGKGKVDKPVQSCAAGTSFPLEDPSEDSVCGGGRAASCPNNQPWRASSNLSFGFAAAAVGGSHGLTGDENCGQCFELRFTGGSHPNAPWDPWGGAHPKLVGKTMVIQVTNIGYDVTGDHSFDLQIPGAGQGIFSDGCTAQFQGFSEGDFDCDNRYGGCDAKGGCDRLPLDLQAGCKWRYDWYHWLEEGGKSNNPFVDFRRVRCPPQIVAVSGSTPLDDADYPEIDPALLSETTPVSYGG